MQACIQLLMCAQRLKVQIGAFLQIKGPDNPTCQLLPTSSKRKVKMAWGKQEREKRW